MNVHSYDLSEAANQIVSRYSTVPAACNACRTRKTKKVQLLVFSILEIATGYNAYSLSLAAL